MPVVVFGSTVSLCFAQRGFQAGNDSQYVIHVVRGNVMDPVVRLGDSLGCVSPYQYP